MFETFDAYIVPYLYVLNIVHELIFFHIFFFLQ